MTPVAALRLALRAMLADLSYPEAQKERAVVEQALDGAGWSETQTQQLRTYAPVLIQRKRSLPLFPRELLGLRHPLRRFLVTQVNQLQTPLPGGVNYLPWHSTLTLEPGS